MNQAVDVNTKDSIEDSLHSALHKAIDKPYNKNKPKRHEHSSRWAETVVDSVSKSVVVNIYLNFKSPKLTEAQRKALIGLATQGIGKYWSRYVTISSEIYSVTVSARHKADSDFPVILKIDNDAKDYGRSFNAGVFGVDARFIYNKGYFPSVEFADDDFKLTCAHEFGHSVLKAAGGISLSWGHKGSTGVISQAVKKSTPGYPISGPIDLMKYYDDKKQKASFTQLVSNSIASEKDVMRLIWLSKVQWR